MAEEYVTVYSTADPIEAEMLVDVLVQEGVDARLLGTRHGALIGVAQHILDLRIEVPAVQLAQAGELIAAFEKGPPEGDVAREAGDEPEDDAGDDQPARPKIERRNAILAAGCAFVLPGGAHMYARRGWTGLVILLGAVGIIFVTLSERHAGTAGSIAFVALLVCDLVGGQVAVRRANRGVVRGAVAQAGWGAAFVAAAVATGVLIAPLVPRPKRRPDAFEQLVPLLREGESRPLLPNQDDVLNLHDLFKKKPGEP